MKRRNSLEKLTYRIRKLLGKTEFKILLGFLTLILMITPLFFFLDKNLWIVFFNNILFLSFLLFNTYIRNIFYKLGLRFEHFFLKHIDPLIESSYDGKKELTKEIKRIREACFSLAKDNEGALICFELNHSLDKFTKNSVIMNSEISAELIITIFNKNSPLHDGAVVISDNKIKSASAYFPITENKNRTLGKTYGARHRAAIGITEKTDAIVILVSEEKGTVHIVREGILSPQLDRDGFNSIFSSIYE
jgi:diadenylate cyclase